MSQYTYGTLTGLSGNVVMLTPSGGGTFPSSAPGFPWGGPGPVGPGEIGSDAAPSPPGNGSKWEDVLKQLALAGGSALVTRLFGGDSRSASGRDGNGTPTGSAVVAVPAPVPSQAWTGAEAGEDAIGRMLRGTRDPQAPPRGADGGGISPVILAGAAAIVALALFLRR